MFITLSARSLNPKLQIIARGEEPSTESKLIQAGADKVVLPTHIGAERIAEMILFPGTAEYVRGSEHMRAVEKSLQDLGLGLDVAAVHERSEAVGLTVEELETRAKGGVLRGAHRPARRRLDQPASPHHPHRRRRRPGAGGARRRQALQHPHHPGQSPGRPRGLPALTGPGRPRLGQGTKPGDLGVSL
ncbi:MAG: NAD-binding protein [Caulobacteraceae bacterium]